MLLTLLACVHALDMHALDLATVLQQPQAHLLLLLLLLLLHLLLALLLLLLIEVAADLHHIIILPKIATIFMNMSMHHK